MAMRPAPRSGEFEQLEADTARRLALCFQALENPVLQTGWAAEPQIGLPDRERDRANQALGREPAIARRDDHLETEPRVAGSRSAQRLYPNRLLLCPNAVDEVNVAAIRFAQAFRPGEERRDTDAARQPYLARTALAEIEPSIWPFDLHARSGPQDGGQASCPATQAPDGERQGAVRARGAGDREGVRLGQSCLWRAEEGELPRPPPHGPPL